MSKARKILSGLAGRFGKELVKPLRSGKAAIKVEGFSWGDMPSLNYVCTGNPTIGLVRGRIYEIFGPESSGKTTLCVQALVSVQRAGGVAAFVDAEHALDPRYCERLGLDLEELLFTQPDYGEQGLEIAEAYVEAGVDIVVIDSVAALTPQAIIEGTYDKQEMGTHARLMSQSLAKFHKKVAKNKCIAMFINQTRDKIGVMFGSPETTTGGKALKFYASVRLRTMISTAKDKAIKSAGTMMSSTEKKRLGAEGKINCIKNKIFDPFEQTTLLMKYGQGFDAVGDLFDFASKQEKMKVVKTTGGYKVPGIKGVVKYAKLDEHAEWVWRIMLDTYGDKLTPEDEVKKKVTKKTGKKKVTKKKVTKKKVTKKRGTRK